MRIKSIAGSYDNKNIKNSSFGARLKTADCVKFVSCCVSEGDLSGVSSVSQHMMGSSMNNLSGLIVNDYPRRKLQNLFPELSRASQRAYDFFTDTTRSDAEMADWLAEQMKRPEISRLGEEIDVDPNKYIKYKKHFSDPAPVQLNKIKEHVAVLIDSIQTFEGEPAVPSDIKDDIVSAVQTPVQALIAKVLLTREHPSDLLRNAYEIPYIIKGAQTPERVRMTLDLAQLKDGYGEPAVSLSNIVCLTETSATNGILSALRTGLIRDLLKVTDSKGNPKFVRGIDFFSIAKAVYTPQQAHIKAETARQLADTDIELLYNAVLEARLLEHAALLKAAVTQEPPLTFLALDMLWYANTPAKAMSVKEQIEAGKSAKEVFQYLRELKWAEGRASS